MDWSRLLPAPEREYAGPSGPFCFLVLVAIASTARSLIHMFASDGGAASIAGLAINVAGGRNLVAIFGQWGSSQVLLVLLYWVVILRYRTLTPLMIGVVVLEQLLRMGIGHLKPLQVAVPPPGAIGSQLLLPIAVVMLLWCLWPATRGR